MAGPHTSCASDDQYRIEDTEHYKTLAKNNYNEHLKLGKSISPEQCIVLASRLLSSSEFDAVMNKERVQYLGPEVLNIWMGKVGSTIWVLKGQLKDLGLIDALAILDVATLDYVSLYIYMYEKEENDSVKELYRKRHNNIPGGKPLVDVIRPIVFRTQGLRMAQPEKGVLCFRLVRSADGYQDPTWNSPARNFKSVQVDIRVRYISALVRRHTDPGQKLEGVIRVERNVISWIEDDSLCFGYDECNDDSEPVAAGQDPDQLIHPVQEVGRQDLTESLDGLSLKSDSSLEGHVFGQTKEGRTSTTLETDESSNYPGIRIRSDDPKTEEETSTGDQLSQHP